MYGTFDELSESVINDGGNVHEVVGNMMGNNCKTKNDCSKCGIDHSVSQSKSKAKHQASDEKQNDKTTSSSDKILLFDEVDVFF